MKYDLPIFSLDKDGYGLSIIGMGIGADSGVEKLGIYVKKALFKILAKSSFVGFSPFQILNSKKGFPGSSSRKSGNSNGRSDCRS